MRIHLIRSALAGLLAVALLLIVGCSEEQIRRAESIAAAASARADQAEQAVELAQAAVASAKELATKLESEQALRIVGQAEQALEVAVASKDAAKTAADTAEKAVASAKAAQEAGGSTVDVVIAVITTAIPTIGALLLALRKVVESARQFRQVVAGVEKAKESMPPDHVAKLHTALSAKMDEGAKQRVRLVKATVVALLLCAVSLSPAADLGLGPVPVNAALATPGPIGSTTPSSGAFTTLSASGTTTLVTTLINDTTARTYGAVAPALQVAATSAAGSAAGIVRHSAAGNAPRFIMGASRGAAGTATAVQSGDILAQIEAIGADGTNYATVGANQQAVVDAAVSTGIVPTGWRWDCRNSAGTLAQRMGLSSGGNLTLSSGSLVINSAGAGLLIKEGANARMGTATLAAGTVVVSTTAVTASSRIHLTGNTDGGTPGWLRVSARSAGTSFTITSSSGTDTSTVAWVILEPAP